MSPLPPPPRGCFESRLWWEQTEQALAPGKPVLVCVRVRASLIRAESTLDRVWRRAGLSQL